MRKKIRNKKAWGASKYGNIKTVIDGHRFDSKKEADHYIHLKVRQSRGEISNLELQPKFPLAINGAKICTYKADFAYDENGKRITVDVKGFKTPIYKLKKKLLSAIYGVQITEV